MLLKFDGHMEQPDIVFKGKKGKIYLKTEEGICFTIRVYDKKVEVFSGRYPAHSTGEEIKVTDLMDGKILHGKSIEIIDEVGKQ